MTAYVDLHARSSFPIPFLLPLKRAPILVTDTPAFSREKKEQARIVTCDGLHFVDIYCRVINKIS